jgi:hypothetical protein
MWTEQPKLIKPQLDSPPVYSDFHSDFDFSLVGESCHWCSQARNPGEPLWTVVYEARADTESSPAINSSVQGSQDSKETKKTHPFCDLWHLDRDGLFAPILKGE